MGDLGSFGSDAPRRDPSEHTITVCGEEFVVRPRFNALQSVQWAKAIRSDDGVAIGAFTGEILASSMDKETYIEFEKVVAEHDVDLRVLAEVADALMTAAMQEGAVEDRPTSTSSDSAPSRRKTQKRSKGASSLQDKREQRLREHGMVPITESKFVAVQLSNA